MFKKFLIIIFSMLNLVCFAQETNKLFVSPDNTYILFLDKNILNTKVVPDGVVEYYVTHDLWGKKSTITLDVKNSGYANLELSLDDEILNYQIFSGTKQPDTVAEDFILLDTIGAFRDD